MVMAQKCIAKKKSFVWQLPMPHHDDPRGTVLAICCHPFHSNLDWK